MNPIEKELDVFKYLISKYCSKENQKDIIRRAKGPLINKICECILNIINGKIKISPQDLEKLKPYKNLFRKLLIKSRHLENLYCFTVLFVYYSLIKELKNNFCYKSI